MKVSVAAWILPACLAVSCGAPIAFNQSIAKVKAGMTPAQVENIVGTPDNRQFSGTRVGWTYQFYHTSPQMASEWYDHYVVLFDHGVVYSLYNYSHPSGFQPIDFLDDPARRGENTINIKVDPTSATVHSGENHGLECPYCARVRDGQN